jgi:hypothetical protein
LSEWRLERVPLSTLADRLSEALACPVFIAKPGTIHGVTKPRTICGHLRVSVRGDNQRLDESLARSLEAIGAKYVVRDEAVIITDPDDERTTSFAQTYFLSSRFQTPDEADEFIVEMEDSIDPDEFNFVAGLGPAIYFAPTRHLVVRQNEQLQMQVKQFLANLAADRDNHTR